MEKIKNEIERSEMKHLERIVRSCERLKTDCTEECDAFHICDR